MALKRRPEVGAVSNRSSEKQSWQSGQLGQKPGRGTKLDLFKEPQKGTVNSGCRRGMGAGRSQSGVFPKILVQLHPGSGHCQICVWRWAANGHGVGRRETRVEAAELQAWLTFIL